MDNIPEKLSSLKRPALQKLSKKLGLKANGKNSAMIAAIEKLKQERLAAQVQESQVQDPAINSSSPPNHSSPETWTTPPSSPVQATPYAAAAPPVSPVPVASKTRGRKEKGAESDLAVSPATPNAISPTDVRLSRKRQRRGTYSLSPGHDNSLCIPHATKHPRLDRGTVTPVNPECKVEEIESRVMDEEYHTPPFSPPFSPPSSSERERKADSLRKRKLTFTKEDSCGSSPMMMDVSEGPPAKRKRHSTFNVSPNKNSFSDSGTNLGPVSRMGVQCPEPDKMDDGCYGDVDTKSQLLSLLDKRVEARTADPNYKPEHIASRSMASSRIPVKSVLAKKFDKAHKKNFKRMQSITSCCQARSNKKKSLTSIARASVNASPGSPIIYKRGTRRVTTAVDVVYKRGTRRVTTAVGVVRSSAKPRPFKPSVTNTRNASFEFNAKEKAVSFVSNTLKPRNAVSESTNTQQHSKIPSKKSSILQPSVVKTPSKPFVFTAENNPSTKKEANRKTTFDLGASLKRPRPKYRTYAGKLPKV